MIRPSDIAGVLDALNAQAMAAEATDVEEMIRLRSAVENILAEADQIPQEIGSLLDLSRAVLQELGRQQCPSPSPALDAVSAALGCARSTWPIRRSGAAV